MDVPHPRVLARDCHHIQAASAAHCAVGHDRRAYPSGDGGQRARNGGCEGQRVEEVDVLEAQLCLKSPCCFVPFLKYRTAQLLNTCFECGTEVTAMCSVIKYLQQGSLQEQSPSGMNLYAHITP